MRPTSSSSRLGVEEVRGGQAQVDGLHLLACALYAHRSHLPAALCQQVLVGGRSAAACQPSLAFSQPLRQLHQAGRTQCSCARVATSAFAFQAIEQ